MNSLRFALAPIALALSLPGTVAMAQTAPVAAIAPTSTLLSVNAEARSFRKPDLAVFSAGVTSQGKTAAEALAANSADMNRVLAALKKAGIADRDIQTAQKLQTECNKVIDLLIKTGVFRGLKTVLHYMDVVSVPLCRKPFGPVDEKYLPELKALAQQLMQERG